MTANLKFNMSVFTKSANIIKHAFNLLFLITCKISSLAFVTHLTALCEPFRQQYKCFLNTTAITMQTEYVCY
jgi:hypothetical protein